MMVNLIFGIADMIGAFHGLPYKAFSLEKSRLGKSGISSGAGVNASGYGVALFAHPGMARVMLASAGMHGRGAILYIRILRLVITKKSIISHEISITAKAEAKGRHFQRQNAYFSSAPRKIWHNAAVRSENSAECLFLDNERPSLLA